MKIKTIVILLFLFAIHVSYGQQKKDTLITNSINRFEKRIKNLEIRDNDEIKNSIENVNNRISSQQAFNEQILNGISLQLESASYNLTIFGLLFAIAAIGFGAYVTYVERKVVKIGDEAKILLSKNQKIKEDVEEINRLIQSDIYNLYLKIKREETGHIIERLINIPKDVLNVGDSLLARELQEEDFPKLKRAYMKLARQDNVDDDYKDYYKVIFFQHFLNLTLKDEILRKEMLGFIPRGIEAAFENDMIKSTQDFTATLVNYGLAGYTNEINQFFNGLSRSEYKNFEEVYKVLFESLKSKKNRFDLWDIISASPGNGIANINYHSCPTKLV